MDWEKTMDERYGSACLSSDFLIVASYSASLPVSTHFTIFWVETGEIYNPVFTLVYTEGVRDAKVISIASAQEGGIYALVKYSRNLETIAYSLDLIEFSINANKAITLAIIAKRDLPGETLTDDIKKGFNKYPPVHIFLYYPSGNTEYDIPGVLLAGHLKPSEHTGLSLYRFSRTGEHYSFNPFAVPSNGSCSYRVRETDKCLMCNTQHVLASPFICGTNCRSNYFLESNTNKCTVCHLSCTRCSGLLSNQCTDCGNAATFNPVLAQCLCNKGRCFSNGICGITCKGSSSYKFNAVRDSSPSYSFDLAQHYNKFLISPSTDDESTPFYKFSACMKSKIKPNEMPREFFLGLWVYQSSPEDNSIILSGLSGISFQVITNPVHNIRFSINNRHGTLVQQLTTHWGSATWRYFAMSIKNEPLTYHFTTYTYSVLTTGEIYEDMHTSKGYTGIIHFSFDPYIYIGCTS